AKIDALHLRCDELCRISLEVKESLSSGLWLKHRRKHHWKCPMSLSKFLPLPKSFSPFPSPAPTLPPGFRPPPLRRTVLCLRLQPHVVLVLPQ
uniref:Ovule protein n=1 Tax=Mesocestoides corti TaxID=53468 RepID=A0A5K3FZ15_MESCO